MTKHQRTAGQDFRLIPINGKQYKSRPLTLGIYAQMEAYIVSRRPDPLLIAAETVKKLPASCHDAVWKAAMANAVQARTVTQEEAAAFENSLDGFLWKLWQSLKTDHPEVDSLEKARAIVMEAGENGFELLARSIELSSGEADLKKSTGQVEEVAEVVLAGQ